ncbi:MAG: hypothetical protein U1E70_29035 [Acetobacteraceae bacterium]|nr:hypothetical protein [Pseudomonadota bacterium]
MRRTLHTALGGIAAVLVLTGTAAAGSKSKSPGEQAFPRLSTTDGAPLELAARPGSPADQIARQLMAPEIAKARAHGDNPLVLVGMARLNDRDEMLFVQLQSPRECGSAGCSTASFKNVNGRWIRTMDTVGGLVRIAASRHRGMPDVIMDGNRLIWDGARYRDVG